MHELALCQGLIDAVERVARREHGACVTGLTVKLGALSGVEPLLLARAFEVARAGTVASRAVLTIEAMSVRIECEDCGAQGEVPAQRLLCGQCGGWRVRVVAGEELQLTRVELERGESVGRRARLSIVECSCGGRENV